MISRTQSSLDFNWPSICFLFAAIAFAIAVDILWLDWFYSGFFFGVIIGIVFTIMVWERSK